MQAGWHLPKQGVEPEVKVVAMMLGAFWPPEAAACLSPDPAGTSILHGQSSDESNRGEENGLNGDNLGRLGAVSINNKKLKKKNFCIKGGNCYGEENGLKLEYVGVQKTSASISWTSVSGPSTVPYVSH